MFAHFHLVLKTNAEDRKMFKSSTIFLLPHTCFVSYKCILYRWVCVYTIPFYPKCVVTCDFDHCLIFDRVEIATKYDTIRTKHSFFSRCFVNGFHLQEYIIFFLSVECCFHNLSCHLIECDMCIYTVFGIGVAIKRSKRRQNAEILRNVCPYVSN